MSIFSYNGVQLALTKTRLFRVDTVKDPSGTDVLWNKYTIQVSGILTRTLGEVSTNSSELLNEVKHSLKLPRRVLSYQCGSLQVQANGLDAALGPEPEAVEVHQISPGMFFVDWGGTVCLADCPGQATYPVVSLRWTQSESFDENWYAKLVTQGRLIVRSDIRTTADSFRNLCVPGLLTDYKREEEKFTLSENGCELEFYFADQEKYRLPPYGATKASGRFTVILKNSSKRTGQCDITLVGPKGQSRADLMALAIRMAVSKLRAEGFPEGTGGTRMPPVLNGSFSEDLFECSVSVSMSAMLAPVNLKSDTSFIRGAGTNDFATANRQGLAPPVRARLLALLSPAFRDPCNDGNAAVYPSLAVVTSSTAAATAAGSTAYPSGYTANQTISIGTLTPNTSPTSTAVSDTAPYDTYEIESAYIYDSGYVQMPGTGVGSEGQKSAFVKNHGGFMQMEVTWYATRKGMPPVIPRFLSPNSNFVALSGSVVPEGIDVSADHSQPIYTVSGFYRYGVINPNLVNAAAPIPPFLTDAAAAASPQTAGFFSDRILWRFQGQGDGPFKTTTIDQAPGQAVADALGMMLGIAGFPTSPPYVPPPPLSPPNVPPGPPEA